MNGGAIFGIVYGSGFIAAFALSMYSLHEEKETSAQEEARDLGALFLGLFSWLTVIVFVVSSIYMALNPEATQVDRVNLTKS